MPKESKLAKNFIISTFVLLYAMVSVISTIHVIDFFKLSNPDWLAITLAIAFEVGAAASLASIIALRKMNKGIVWALFFTLTAMQAMGNAYYAYVHLHDYQNWIELFGLVDEDPIFQKRILSLVSGAILPLVALGFIKSLVDYMKPEDAPEIQDMVAMPATSNVTLLTDTEIDSTKQLLVEEVPEEVITERTEDVEIEEKIDVPAVEVKENIQPDVIVDDEKKKLNL